MYTEELKFYPKHPSGEKTNKIETTEMPKLEQTSPFEVKNLYEEFTADADTFFEKYVDKRFEVTGIAKKIGPDIHNKPSIEISDCADGKTYALVIFPTDDHYQKVEIGDTVTVCANYLVMSNHFGTVMKYSELVSVKKNRINSPKQNRMILNYPFFDGKKVVEDAAVVIEDGRIAQIVESQETDHEYFLMPGLMDAHTHMSAMQQVVTMQKNGITAVCDVAASKSLIESARPFTIVASAGMTTGTLNGKAYVQKAIEEGAKYIKVLLMEPMLMMKSVLKDICVSAHKHGLKVAAHAVSIKAVRLSVECGVDILIHVPMKEVFPLELAQEIAERGIVSAPTLIMMKTFAYGGKGGYKPEHYANAENAVKLLYENGVQILAATDANIGAFAPAVSYGSSLHTEMELLVYAGMKPEEVLSAATDRIAKVFGIEDAGNIAVGKRANLVLVKGRPDKNITDTTQIKKVWIDGNTIL